MGVTGHGARPPTAEQIEEWREKRGDDGIAFVLQDGELVIDIDNYAKGEWPAGTGAATMAEVRERAGCDLPRGPKLRNRTDGSEKRPFRVPTGLKCRKGLGPCVDVVTPTHRYVNAGINPDTGNAEQWFDADDNALDEPPPPDTWPELPEAWLPFVIQDHGEEGQPAALATNEQAQAWLDGMCEGPIGALVRETLNDALAGLDGRWGSRHDRTQEQVRWLVEMGAAGLRGVPEALTFLKEQYIDAVKDDRRGGARAAEHEFDGYDSAMVQWAARVCRPEVFDTLRRLEHTGYEGWLAGVEAAAVAGDAQPSNDDGDERVTRSLADVEPSKVEWLWPYWIPLGKVSIIEGEPGEGKSLLTLAMTALVTTGGEWPMTMVDGPAQYGGERDTTMLPRTSFGPAGVVLVGVEDDEADTVVPRLDAAGAERSLVYAIDQPTDDNGEPRPFVIPEDTNRLRQAILEVDAKLVFIDPLTAFLSTRQVRAGDDPSTRQALMPLVTRLLSRPRIGIDYGPYGTAAELDSLRRRRRDHARRSGTNEFGSPKVSGTPCAVSGRLHRLMRFVAMKCLLAYRRA